VLLLLPPPPAPLAPQPPLRQTTWQRLHGGTLVRLACARPPAAGGQDRGDTELSVHSIKPHATTEAYCHTHCRSAGCKSILLLPSPV
jgi:hypothetical protein